MKTTLFRNAHNSVMSRGTLMGVLLWSGMSWCTLTHATEGPIEGPATEDSEFEAKLAPQNWAQPGRDSKDLPATIPGADAAAARPLPKADDIELDAPAPDAFPQRIESHSQAGAGIPLDEPTSLILLGTEVAPNTTSRLSWSPSHIFEGIAVPTPVLVVNGAKPGPRLCLTAAVHGDELNGIEVVRRVMYRLESENLAGAVIGVPIVNLQGFRRSSRYLPDRRDLNRFFPGTEYGSSASRIANSLFKEIISHCNALVDLHTGSFYRTNLPQLRADLTNPKVEELAHAFSSLVVMHSKPAVGTLRQAATAAGIPTVTLEAGEPMRFQESEVSAGVLGIWSLLNSMGMYPNDYAGNRPQPVYYQSKWLRVNQGGILFSEVELGSHVSKGQLLGTVTDPITNVRLEIHSPFDGRILGMALDQFVMPGFAAYRIGLEPENAVSEKLREPVLEEETAHTSQAESKATTTVDDFHIDLESSE